jgi:SAM-dependent methyltransferase
VDIGSASLAKAKSRTTNLPQVTLLTEDAAQLGLADASLDGIYSRFGVMFFSDPAEAFANFRRMLRTGGRISFVCWRSLKENELDLLPLEAAALVVEVDATPFSFERPEFITHTLQAAGFGNIEVQAFDAPVSSGDIADMMAVLTKVGALGKVLRETPSLLSEAEPRVHAALLQRAVNDQVSLNAATWIVTADAI